MKTIIINIITTEVGENNYGQAEKKSHLISITQKAYMNN